MLILKLFMPTFFLALISTQMHPVQKTSDVIQKVVALDILKQFEKTPAFLFLKNSVPVAGTLITTFFTFFDMNQKDPHAEVMKKLEEISTQLDKITESIENVDNRIVSEASRNNVITVMEKFVIKYSEISKSEHKFNNIVRSYATNETALLQNLVEFLNDEKKAYNEYSLVDYLTVKFIGLTSPVDEFIHFGRNAEHGSYVPKSSTTKLVFDFHLTILTKFLRSFTIQELATELKFKLSGRRYDEDVKFLENRKQLLIKKLDESLNASMNKLNANDLKIFAELNVKSIKSVVKFRNVLQTLIEGEEKLSGDGKCTKQSRYFPRVSYNANGCNGELRECRYEKQKFGNVGK